MITQKDIAPNTLEVFGSTTKYWDYHPDQKQTILVVHGYRGTHDGLRDIVELLPEYRFIIPDLPGFGESTPMTARPNTVEGYAAFTVELKRLLKLDQITLLGHSMGTAVAGEIMVLDPNFTDKLILINPISIHPLKGWGKFIMAPGVLYHWLGGRALPKELGRKLLSNRWFLLFGSITMTKTRDQTLRQHIHSRHLAHMPKFHDRDTLYEAYLSSLDATVTKNVDKITTPTLLIAGKNDAIAPIEGSRMLAGKMKNAQLVEFDNVGHLVHYEKAAESAAAIKKFLDQTTTA